MGCEVSLFTLRVIDAAEVVQYWVMSQEFPKIFLGIGNLSSMLYGFLREV